MMTTPAPPNCVGYRFPSKIISHAVWLYFRFPLSLPLCVNDLRDAHISYRTWRYRAFERKMQPNSMACRFEGSLVLIASENRQAKRINRLVRCVHPVGQ